MAFCFFLIASLKPCAVLSTHKSHADFPSHPRKTVRTQKHFQAWGQRCAEALREPTNIYAEALAFPGVYSPLVAP